MRRLALDDGLDKECEWADVADESLKTDLGGKGGLVVWPARFFCIAFCNAALFMEGLGVSSLPRVDGCCRASLSVLMVGGSDPDESSGTSRTRHEKTREPSSKIEVSGKEEKAMLSRSSRLIPRGGYRNSRSGPSSRSKLTQPTERTQRCMLSRSRLRALAGFAAAGCDAGSVFAVEKPESVVFPPDDVGLDAGLDVDGDFVCEFALPVVGRTAEEPGDAALLAWVSREGRRGSVEKVGVLGDGACSEVLLLGTGRLFVLLDSEVLGESRSRKLVIDGEEGLVPDALSASTPRSPYPLPAEVRLEASRKEALRGGALGPPPPTGRRSCRGGRPDRRLRLEERREMASVSMTAEEDWTDVSGSASSSCSTLTACLPGEKPDAREREVGRLACVIVKLKRCSAAKRRMSVLIWRALAAGWRSPGSVTALFQT